MPHTAVITHALRTPIGKYLGTLSDFSAPDLGTFALKALLERAHLDAALVDEVIFGHGRQVGSGPNPARQIAVRSGVPVATPALTVNQACASGLRAVVMACESIMSGRNTVVIAGGVESMSNMPYLIPEMRKGLRLGHKPLVDAMYQDGFMCPLAKQLMGETAETLARQYQISREEQDAFALSSQRKAQAARLAGAFDAEIAPISIRDRKGAVSDFRLDEHARDDTTPDSLAKLPPVFDAKTGTITAGNSSGITDGAAVLLVMSENMATKLGFEPLARFEAWTQAGVGPEVMGIGPVPALRKLVELNHRKLEAYDLIELNEAFAAQVLACHRELGFDLERLNVNGGAIALGHPIGCTGARIVVTLVHEMRRRAARHGLATLCVSGGMGVALSLSR